MSTRRYVLVFGGGLMLIGALIAAPYVLELTGIAHPFEKLQAYTGDSAGVSVLNVGITVILFILLAFSILNIYSFFNSNIDAEKRELRERQTALETNLARQKSEIASEADEISNDLSELEDRSLYQRNLMLLTTNRAPVFVRAAAAGYFLAHRPVDNDMLLIKSVREELAASGVETKPIVDQLDFVEKIWGQ